MAFRQPNDRLAYLLNIDALRLFAVSNLCKIVGETQKYASSTNIIYEASKPRLNQNVGSSFKITRTLVVECFDQSINGMTFGVAVKVKNTIR